MAYNEKHTKLSEMFSSSHLSEKKYCYSMDPTTFLLSVIYVLSQHILALVLELVRPLQSTAETRDKVV